MSGVRPQRRQQAREFLAQSALDRLASPDVSNQLLHPIRHRIVSQRETGR